MTNMILVVAAAGLGFIAQKGLEPSMLIVSGALILIGTYGALASAKYYERFRLHLREAGAIREKIDEIYADLKLGELADTMSREQAAEFPHLIRVPLYGVWISLHVGIAVAGTLLSVLILVRQ
ncbi:hypothetical protein ACWD69_06555 [Micromonospora chokoriensis]